MKTSLFVSGAAALLLLSSSALADKQHFVGQISGNAEVPPVTNSPACNNNSDGCTVSFTYDTVTHRLCGHALFAKALDVQAAHIHQAETTASGPVIQDLAPQTGSQTSLAFDVVVSGNGSVTAEAAQKFISDDFALGSATADPIIYFNVHTTENPGGDSRANVRADEVAPTLDECLEFDDAGTGTPDSGVTTTPTDGGGTTVGDSGTDTSTSSDDTSSSCSTAPGTSPGSVMLMLGAAIAVGSIVRSRKKR